MITYHFKRDPKEIARSLAKDKKPIDERGVIVVAKMSAEEFFEYEEQRQRQAREFYEMTYSKS